MTASPPPLTIPRAILNHYFELVARVDARSDAIRAAYRDRIACRKGCDACCGQISVFPVEAVRLGMALSARPPAEVAAVLDAARGADDDAPCPLIHDGACRLYPARPIICRTHGLPILRRNDAEPVLDCCPLNFKGIKNFPSAALIDLDRLNNALWAVNHRFCAEWPHGDPPQRLSVAAALLTYGGVSDERTE